MGQAKKLVKSNKSISQIIFLTKFHFLQLQKCPKINFWIGKKIKTAKNAISLFKKIIYVFQLFFMSDIVLWYLKFAYNFFSSDYSHPWTRWCGQPSSQWNHHEQTIRNCTMVVLVFDFPKNSVTIQRFLLFVGSFWIQ